jgi:hypothetical protein
MTLAVTMFVVDVLGYVRFAKPGVDFLEKALKVFVVGGGGSPTDPALYDAVFNNGRHGVAEIARAIIAYVREAWTKRDTAQQTALV